MQAIIDGYARSGALEAEGSDFESAFWTAMAEATHNQFYIGQLAFWNHWSPKADAMRPTAP